MRQHMSLIAMLLLPRAHKVADVLVFREVPEVGGGAWAPLLFMGRLAGTWAGGVVLFTYGAKYADQGRLELAEH